MNENSRIIRNSLILYIRFFLNAVIGLFSSRFLLQGLGVSDFGLYSLIGSIVVLMGLLNTVMVSTSFRYISLEIGKGCDEDVNKVFNTSLVIHIGLALFIALIAEFVGSFYIQNFMNIDKARTSDAVFVLRCSILATVFTILSIPFQAIITAYEQFKTRSSIELLASALKLLIAYSLLFYMGNKLRLYSLLVLIVSLVSPILFYMFCRLNYPLVIRWNFHRDNTAYKEMLRYTSWILLGTTASLGKIHCSALIINSFFGLIVNAAFSIAAQVNVIVQMFAKSLGQAAIPQITKSYGAGNPDRTMLLTRCVAKYSFYLMLLPALPILLKTEFVLKLWLGELPPYSTLFCQLMIVNAMIDSTNTGMSSAILATGKVNKFIIITSVISLISLPLSYALFVYEYPAYSVLIVYIISSIVIIAAQLVLLKKTFNYDVTSLIKSTYLKILYVIACVMPVVYLKQMLADSFPGFIGIAIISLTWTVIVIFFVGLEKEERNYVNNTISILFKKLISRVIIIE